jgi:hypothetical protein
MKLLDFDMSLIPEIKSGKYKVVTKNNKRVIINTFYDERNKEFPIDAVVYEQTESVRIRYDKDGKPARIFDKSYSLMLLERGFEETELETILKDFYGERALLGDCGGDIWKYVKCYSILEEYAKKIKELFTKNQKL